MTSERRPSLRDVARAAGVSPTTVSLALRSSPQIPPATRRRVREAARAIGYKQNPIVSAVYSHVRKPRDRGGLGVLAYLRSPPPRTGNPSAAHLLAIERGADERALQLGFRLDRISIENKELRSSKRLGEILRTRGARGAVIGPRTQPLSHLRLPWDDLAWSTIGFSLARPNLPRVATYHLEAILAAVRVARKLGYRRPGLALYRAEDVRVNHRYTGGYLIALHTLLGRDRSPIHLLDDSSPLKLARWIDRHRIDLLLSAGERALPWLRRAGFTTPADIGFLSLDLSPQAAAEGVTGILHDLPALGAAAVDLVTTQIVRGASGLQPAPPVVLIPGGWQEGRTLRKQRGKPALSPRAYAGPLFER